MPPVFKEYLLKEFTKALTVHAGYDFYRDRTYKKMAPYGFALIFAIFVQ